MRNVFSYLYNRTKNQIRVSFGRKIYFFVSWTSFRDFLSTNTNLTYGFPMIFHRLRTNNYCMESIIWLTIRKVPTIASVFVMYQLSPPLPSPTPNKPYFILSSHPGDCINHWVELFQGQNFHNTTFFRTHRHPKPSEIYNNTMLLFVRKLLRQEITQSQRQ